MDGTMHRRASRFWGLVAWGGLSLLLSAVALTGYAGYHWVTRSSAMRGGSAGSTLGTESNAVLSAEDVEQVEQLVRSMMNADAASEASLHLRHHLEGLVLQQSPLASLTMVLTLEQLAPRFGSLDSAQRQFSLSLLADILAWHGQNATGSWAGLLAPAKSILGAALDDSVPDVTLGALEILRDAWPWVPPGAKTPPERKTLGIWKAELQERSVQLLDCRDSKIRGAAAATVALGPLESAAQKAIALRHDGSPYVRRNLLLALSDSPVCMPSEDILPFLNDRDLDVRTTAELVLSCRGVEREEIILARRATNPSALVRAQTARYVLESSGVDRTVWLGHLSRDEASEVRAEAARAMAVMSDNECRSRLAEMAETDPEPAVRQLAGQLVRESPPGSGNRAPTTASSDPVDLPTLPSPRAN